MDIYLAGVGMGLSLIVAIGAQNVFVLRQGLRREHVGVVVLICAISDAVLIAAGVGGVGALVATIPWLLPVVKWAGAAFLLVYGALAALRAWRSQASALEAQESDARGRSSLGAVAFTALALTWLNPHVYLDTVFLLGSIATTQASPWVFGAGAMTASVVWFAALGYGARKLSPLLSTPKAWRVLDALVALVMVALAVMLVVTA